MDDGEGGKVLAVAVAPGGERIAVATRMAGPPGETTPFATRASQYRGERAIVYVFDRADGRIVGRIVNLPAAALHLA